MMTNYYEKLSSNKLKLHCEWFVSNPVLSPFYVSTGFPNYTYSYISYLRDLLYPVEFFSKMILKSSLL